MRVGVLGINHKSSGLNFREVFARACQKKLSPDNGIAQALSCVILSTCNRTEIYFSASDLPEAHSLLLGVLRSEIQEAFEHMLYTYFGVDCFVHLALVTAGLDSIIIAESEIQRQVKVSYQNTLGYYSLPSCLHYLFQKSLKIGKHIRSSFSISQGQPTLPGMILQVAQILFNDLEKQKILFIGHSDINRKVIAFFKARGLTDLSVCTRSEGFLDAQRLDWKDLSCWKTFDLIICGTYAPCYLIEATDGLNLFEPKLILDLSVPRSVDPAIGRHPLVTLLNIEELGQFIDQSQSHNLADVDRAEQMVWNEAEKLALLFQLKEKKAAHGF